MSNHWQPNATCRNTFFYAQRRKTRSSIKIVWFITSVTRTVHSAMLLSSRLAYLIFAPLAWKKCIGRQFLWSCKLHLENLFRSFYVLVAPLMIHILIISDGFISNYVDQTEFTHRFSTNIFVLDGK